MLVYLVLNVIQPVCNRVDVVFVGHGSFLCLRTDGVQIPPIFSHQTGVFLIAVLFGAALVLLGVVDLGLY